MFSKKEKIKKSENLKEDFSNLKAESETEIENTEKKKITAVEKFEEVKKDIPVKQTSITEEVKKLDLVKKLKIHSISFDQDKKVLIFKIESPKAVPNPAFLNYCTNMAKIVREKIKSDFGLDFVVNIII